MLCPSGPELSVMLQDGSASWRLCRPPAESPESREAYVSCAWACLARKDWTHPARHASGFALQIFVGGMEAHSISEWLNWKAIAPVCINMLWPAEGDVFLYLLSTSSSSLQPLQWPCSSANSYQGICTFFLKLWPALLTHYITTPNSTWTGPVVLSMSW
jgi:hypothetical protein